MEGSGSGLQRILEDIEEGVFALDAGCSFTYLNSAAERIFERTRDELFGSSLREQYPEMFSSAFYRGYQRVMSEQLDVDLEEYWLRDSQRIEVGIRPLEEGVVVRLRIAGARSETEGVLTRRERRLSESQRLSGVGIWEWEVRSNSLVFSDEQYRIFGIDRRTFSGTCEAFLERIHPDDREHVARSLQEGLDSPATFEHEYRIVRAGGAVRRIEGTAKAVRDPQGNPVRMVGSARDVTDLRRKEEELREKEKRLSTLTTSAPVILFALNTEGIFTLVQGRGLQALGLASDQLVGRSVFEAYAHQPEVLGYVRRALAGEEVTALVELEGGVALECRWSPATFREGVPDGVIGVATDITERVQALRQLASADARYRQVVETVRDAVITMGAEGRIRSFNHEAQRIFGYGAEETVGRPLTMLMPESLREHHTEGLRRYLRTGESRVISRTVELTGLRKDGAEFPLELSVAELAGGEERLFTGIVRDISERKTLEAQLEHQTFHDRLTGLPNRALFMDRLSQALMRGASTNHDGQGEENHERSVPGQKKIAVLLIDLDRFKLINESVGQEVADTLLCEIGKRLRVALAAQHTMARLGGDEFAVLIEGVAGADEATRVAQQLTGALGLPFTGEGLTQPVRASIGVALSTPDTESPTDLMRNADIAMYRAKRSGGAGHELYDPQMGKESARGLALEGDLRRAVEQEEFELHYQPLIELASGRVIGMEALLRWDRPGHGMTPPDEFIPVAEETGLIAQIGGWALGEACRQAALWQDRYPEAPGVSVNLSPRQLRTSELAAEVANALGRTNLAPSALTLELTENALMEQVESAAEVVSELKALGVAVAIDDFGTGYSSLGRLEQLPVDLLKIDRSFIAKLEGGPTESAIVEAVVGLARGLGLQVVAEGIETPEQLSTVRSLECDVGQGYYFGRPVPAAEAEAMLDELLTLVLGGYTDTQGTGTNGRQGYR